MRKSPTLLLCALAGLGAQRVHAAQAPVDADLLEFLGSIGEDDDWQDYLEQKPVKAAAGKAAKDAQKAPAKSPGKPGVPAASKEKDK
ncbi:MAG TPA: hypothetical protein VKO83_09405 [Steroidobacteraceae bacterium]|nr:hypothetical protein [Steroidobacteraceae bacterium]